MANNGNRDRGGNAPARAGRLGIRGGPPRGPSRGSFGGSSRTSGSGPDSPSNAVPANWPSNVTYLTTPVYAGISQRQRKMLQTQPADLPGAPASTPPLSEVPSILRFGPSPLVEIRSITDPHHPACGQRGLFAARNLRAGSFILPYLGVYHRGNVAAGRPGTNPHNKRESDYDLWLDREADVAVDADRQGNEARFINDYRGTGKPRANAEFREVWDPRRGERGMAVFVLPAGKRALLQAAANGQSSSTVGGIAQGDEILVSYGKGFWEMRQKEAEEARAQEAPATGEEGETAAGEQAAGASALSTVPETESTTQPEAAEEEEETEEEETEAKEEDVSGRPQADSVSDQMGSLKVVGRFPKNIAWA
ncbi:hypothetical protein SPBR_01852 [Sporothrix brasiliensis 5110]|uniref:SET domain-containing protein n=1 Tax=Sporothrix brasiliensis 5110 TaxID=1398154 RepID=A0A0C2J2E5_9PEZI|nr:uncharacterized protein SPBR_01852 [Sporothrix brasiliensis 5110]KIH91252.1 hypothetical protein SPBR_01852 [Sporothrix brasiliensis 5110]